MACNRARQAKWRNDNPERARAEFIKWKAANPEKAKAATAAWRKENAERFREIRAEWRANNKATTRASHANWRRLNREADRVHQQNRRARKISNGGTLSIDLAEKLFKLQKGKCACCGSPLGVDYNLDHRMPLALGGKNEDWNMQLLRKKCNNQKSAKHPVDFMQSKGFLL